MPLHQASTGEDDDDDPVISSYPVYIIINPPPPPTDDGPSSASLDPTADILAPTTPKLLLLQYPAHRPADFPYNVRNLQKPTSLRLKPSTGLLELDIPIDTKYNYNRHRGAAYATSLSRSRIVREGGAHGLSGGFTTGAAGRIVCEDEDVDMKTIPAHASVADEPAWLSVQTLGGKVVKPCPGDPIYMLGSFQNNALHLSHLDAIVQARPQLPHLDAADELERNRALSAVARAKGKDGAAVNGDVPVAATPSAAYSARPESKAIDIKLKSSGPLSQDNDISTNTNAKLLRRIQQEPWQTYEWIDEDDIESEDRARTALHFSHPPPANGLENRTKIGDLRSAITNSEWLDLMSAPRVEHARKGDKGLMSKVRGRERERQRKRRNEATRRDRAIAITAHHGGVAAAARVSGGPFQENPAGVGDGVGTEDEGAAASDDHGGGQIGPSDESSEDDANDGDEADVQMVDTPNVLPAEEADFNDIDVHAVQRG